MIDKKGIDETGKIVNWHLFDSYMRKKLNEQNKQWLIQAVLFNPQDSICGWCGEKNDFADDCGFIYTTPYGDDTRPTCETCYRSLIGEMHIKRYGVGER